MPRNADMIRALQMVKRVTVAFNPLINNKPMVLGAMSRPKKERPPCRGIREFLRVISGKAIEKADPNLKIDTRVLEYQAPDDKYGGVWVGLEFIDKSHVTIEANGRVATDIWDELAASSNDVRVQLMSTGKDPEALALDVKK